MSDPVSIPQLLKAIRALPADDPVVDPRKWYTTQKQHWIGWLSEYGGPGAYGRRTDIARNARYAYNHIVEPKMLLWLIAAAEVDPKLVADANRACSAGRSLAQQSAMIRRAVPWEIVEMALWPRRSRSS